MWTLIIIFCVSKNYDKILNILNTQYWQDTNTTMKIHIDISKGTKSSGKKEELIGSVQIDGSPQTGLPVVEQIESTTELSDCCVDQASADRWLPPSVVHCAVHNLHWLEIFAQTHNTANSHMHRMEVNENKKIRKLQFWFWVMRQTLVVFF